MSDYPNIVDLYHPQQRRSSRAALGLTWLAVYGPIAWVGAGAGGLLCLAVPSAAAINRGY